MKVREFLLKNELRNAVARLEKLTEIGAPGPMVETQKKMVALLEAGEFPVGGDESLLDTEFEVFEQKRGRGGKPYIEFDNGVKYFPAAQYGRFITK